MSTYLVSEHWEHIFPRSNGKPRIVRFVIEDESMIRVQIQVGTKWRLAFRAEAEDLQDSILTGNPDIFDNPTDYDLVESTQIPDWPSERGGTSLA